MVALVKPNLTLEQDGQTLLMVARALGKSDEWLKMGNVEDVAKWRWISVERKRVVRVFWGDAGLCGTIPEEIGALSALVKLDLSGNELQGLLPDQLGNLMFLAVLHLQSNSLSGHVPSSLAKLTNLRYLSLQGNCFTTDVPPATIFNNKDEVKSYLAFTNRAIARYLVIAVSVTTRRSYTRPAPPLYAFLSSVRDTTLEVLSFLGEDIVYIFRAAGLH